MNISPDIRDVLRDWPYDPEKCVRIIAGAGGREILQVRTPVGLEQFELTGRPDGRQPHEHESAFDYQRARFDETQTAGTPAAFHLTHAECVELFEEGILYYFRYLHLFQIEDWTRTIRDTMRNLQLFDFVQQHAQRKEDREHLEQWRPYLLRIHAIARAMLEIAEHAHERALVVLKEAVTAIEELADQDNETFDTERARSLQALRETIERIDNARPKSTLETLELQLHEAVEAQAFERAAALRDKIRTLRTGSVTG